MSSRIISMNQVCERRKIVHDKTLSAGDQTDLQSWLELQTGVLSVESMNASDFECDIDLAVADIEVFFPAIEAKLETY